MDIVHAADLAWGENLAAHRQGHMAHKVLFEGDEGSPDNFLFALAKEDADYFSPRHRHVWDQVRFCLEGSIPLGRKLSLDVGEAGYFPEGTPYGPQEDGPDRVVLILQVGGASGKGFLSVAQMQSARKELGRVGTFEGGAFQHRKQGKKSQDAYEAIWQQASGQPLEYPKPRYKAPILISPDNFPWRETAQGAREKLLGFFPDRLLELKLVGLDEGARTTVDASAMRTLLFVRSGEGRCGEGEYRAHTAVRLDPGETCECMARSASEFLSIAIAPVSAL